MRILLDTHIAIWAVTDSPKLSAEARNIITDKNNEVFYSTASVWETTIKHMLRPDRIEVDGDELADYCDGTEFQILPIVNRHAIAVKTLRLKENAPRHNDPFDRILLAQAKTENMKFMTHDEKIPYYDENFILSV